MSAIRYEVRDNVAEILLDNPPVNALDRGLMDDLLATLEGAGRDDAVGAVIIASAVAGRFCAGLDLGTYLKSSPGEARDIVESLYARLCDIQFNLGKPSIAAIAGAARGGGMSLAISCDMIVAADSATFGYPEIEIGLLPAIHYTHLPRIVGRYRAFDLLFTGRAKSPQLMRMGRKAFMHAIDADYRRGVAGAVNLISAVIGTEDSKEGLTAFVEKRKPNWKPRKA